MNQIEIYVLICSIQKESLYCLKSNVSIVLWILTLYLVSSLCSLKPYWRTSKSNPWSLGPVTADPFGETFYLRLTRSGPIVAGRPNPFSLFLPVLVSVNGSSLDSKDLGTENHGFMSSMALSLVGAHRGSI